MIGANKLIVVMDYIETFLIMTVFTLCLCSVALVAASWLHKNKRGADWTMAIGSSLTLIGMLTITVGVVTEFRFFHDEEIVFLIIGTATLGVLLFTMGFAMDRMQHRQKDKADEYMNEVLPPK